MQLYVRDKKYDSRKKLSKIHQIGPYLLRYRSFIENLKQSVHMILQQLPQPDETFEAFFSGL